MVKLIMTDIDGTLIPDGTMDINPEYFEVIEKLVEKGIIFVVASGRHMSSVKKVFAPVLDKIWVASQNGNVLTYHGKSRIIKSIPQEWGREMWRQFSKLKGVEGVLDQCIRYLQMSIILMLLEQAVGIRFQKKILV